MHAARGVESAGAVGVGLAVGDHDAVHVEGQLARWTAHASLRSGRPVEPQAELQPVACLQLAGGPGGIDGVGESVRRGAVGLLVGLGVAADGGGQQHEPGDALGRLERGVERDLAAHRASHQPGGRIRRHGVEHGKQVIDVPEGRVGRRHVAEPSPVIRDNVAPGASEPRAHLAPAASVADARVKQGDRCAGPVPAITDQRRVPRPRSPAAHTSCREPTSADARCFRVPARPAEDVASWRPPMAVADGACQALAASFILAGAPVWRFAQSSAVRRAL